jgi:hypothetical protein
MTETPAATSGWNDTGPRAARTPAIIGFLIAGAVILVLGFLASLRQAAEPVTAAAPPLYIVAPIHGDTVANPVTIRFHTPADLQLGRAGWTAGDLHLHVMADDREIMPAAADISATGTQFDWRLPPLEPGTRRLYLTWAGRDHRNLIGIADTVYLHVVP